MTTTRPRTEPASRGRRTGQAGDRPTPAGWSRSPGPVVSATDLPHTRLFDVVRVGAERLLGEVIKIDGDLVVMQVFEDTTGLRVGEPVEATGEPLYAELGPGLLGGILDGTQRPLENLSTDGNLYIARGCRPAAARPRPPVGLPARRRGRGPGRTRRPARIGSGGTRHRAPDPGAGRIRPASSPRSAPDRPPSSILSSTSTGTR